MKIPLRILGVSRGNVIFEDARGKVLEHAQICDGRAFVDAESIGRATKVEYQCQPIHGWTKSVSSPISESMDMEFEVLDDECTVQGFVAMDEPAELFVVVEQKGDGRRAKYHSTEVVANRPWHVKVERGHEYSVRWKRLLGGGRGAARSASETDIGFVAADCSVVLR